MTGLPDHNFPAFHAAAARLRQVGWEVVNPAENFGGRTDLPRASYMRADVTMLLQCDAIALLPGWKNSRGAKLEYLIACELSLPIIGIATFLSVRHAPETPIELDGQGERDSAPCESVLDEAKRITEGTRQSDYGHPSDDFARTAAMWTGILAGKLREGESITAMDVPLCMIAVKLARQAHRHKRDNLIDVAGYARTTAMVAGDE